MTAKSRDSFSRETFKGGQRIKLTDEIIRSMPFGPGYAAGTEVLFVGGDEGYRVIPLKPDVRKLYIEPTTVCNFDCITCIRNSWQDDLAHMKMETFNNIKNSLAGLPDLETVHFGGFGEPLTHPGIFDMLRAIKAAGLKAEIITNGSLLTEKVIDGLIELEVDMVFVSLDAPDKEEYESIRQGADFQSVLSNVEKLVEKRNNSKAKLPELGIEFVAMKSNFDKLPELVRISVALKARKLIVTNLLPYHEAMQDQILYDTDDTVNPFGNQSAMSLLMAQFPYMKLRTDRYCKFVEDKAMCINHNGFISPCYALMHAYHCYIYGRKKQIFPYALGSVNDRKLADLWTAIEYVNFRLAVKNFKFPSCPDCKYLEGCSMADNNEMDCWGNSPSCAECLWSRQLIACP